MKKTVLILAFFSTLAIAGPSLTGDMLKRFYRTGQSQMRPSLALFHQTEHFRVWYDTTGYHKIEDIDIDPENNIPDYVEKAGIYLEEAWQKECVELGFREPLKDSLPYTSIEPFDNVGGDDRWDAYLEKMSGGFYGATFVDNMIDSAEYDFATGFMKINGDMRSIYGYEDDPYPALAVTCAHEFQHMCQFHYRRTDGFVWQMEATATFMEEYVFDDINDYYNYAPYFQDSPEKPLNSRGNLYEYGSVLFPIYLAENFGPEIIRKWWENTQLRYTFDALDLALNEHGTSVREEYPKFALWRLHTGDFSIDDFGFEEGSNYPMPAMKDTVSEDFSSYLNGPYSTNYIFVNLADGFNRVLAESGITGELSTILDSSWSFLAAGTGPVGGDQLLGSVSDSLKQHIDETWRYRGVVFAPLYLDDARGEYTLLLTDLGSSEENEPETGPKSPFPNPATDRIFIPFYADKDGNVLISIFDAGGGLLREEVHWVNQGPHLENGALEIDITGLASGIYSYIFTFEGESWKQVFIVK